MKKSLLISLLLLLLVSNGYSQLAGSVDAQTAPQITEKQTLISTPYMDHMGIYSGYFKLIVIRAGFYEIKTSYCEYNDFYDTEGFLYNDQGNQIAYNDDYFDLNFYIGIELQPGTYYIKVQDLGGFWPIESMYLNVDGPDFQFFPASNITFHDVTTYSASISWENGSEDNRVVFMKEDNQGLASPVDNTSYYASNIFGNGHQAGSGWFCVYNGSGSSVNVRELEPFTQYIVNVVEYSGTSGSETYLQETGFNNPAVMTTPPQMLTLTGSFVVHDKTYDDTTLATIKQNDLLLPGVFPDHDVYISHVEVEFSDKNASANVPVTIKNLQIAGADASKYYLSLEGAPSSFASINQRELQVINAWVPDKTYDATVVSIIADAELYGVLPGDDVNLKNSDVGYFLDRNAGENKEFASDMWIGGVDSGNYKLISPQLTGNILPAPLSITAANASKIYGQADPQFNVSYQGFIYGENEEYLSGELSLSREPGENVGSYVLTPSGFSAQNYAIDYVSGNLEITVKDLIVSAQDASKVYGETDPQFAVSYQGFITGENEDNLSGELSFSREPGENVGSYVVTPSGLSSQNYAVDYVSGNIEITAKDLVVTAQDASKVYGETDPQFAVSYQGFITGENEDNLSGELSFSREPGENVGSYVVTPSGLSSQNYAIDFTSANLEITAKDLIVTAQDASKVYGETDPRFAVSYQGFITGENEDNLSGELSFSREPGENVGSYVVTPSGLSSQNYVIDFASANLEITVKDLIVSAQDASKVYGETDPQFAVSYQGFISGENEQNLSGVLSFSREPGENVGSYVVTPSGLSSQNYVIDFASANLEITAKDLIVTAQDASKVYGETDPQFAVSYQGFISGENEDNLSGELSFSREPGENAGSYVVTPSGLSSQNYLIDYIDGSLTIDKRLANISGDFSVEDKTFDGTTAAVIAESSLYVSDLVNDDSIELLDVVAEFVQSAPGNDIPVIIVGAQISGEASANYELSFENAPQTTANIYAQVYALNLIVNPEESGSVAGAGEYTENEVVGIEATAADGYVFLYWTGDTQFLDDSLSVNANVTMPADEVNLVAVFESTTAIDNDHETQLRVYPVPASEFLWVETGNDLPVSVVLLNQQGQVVDKQYSERGEASLRFDVGYLQPGIYIVKTDGRGKPEVKKVIIR